MDIEIDMDAWNESVAEIDNLWETVGNPLWQAMKKSLDNTLEPVSIMNLTATHTDER